MWVRRSGGVCTGAAREASSAAQALHSGWPKDAAQEEGPRRYGARAARWVPVGEGAALGEVLRAPDYVIPGAPVFFVVAAGTAFRERFLADEVPLL